MPLRGRGLVFPARFGDLAPVTPHDEARQDAAQAVDDRTDTYVDRDGRRRKRPDASAGRADLALVEDRQARAAEHMAAANGKPLSLAVSNVAPIRRTTNDRGARTTDPDAAA